MLGPDAIAKLEAAPRNALSALADALEPVVQSGERTAFCTHKTAPGPPSNGPR